MTSKYTKILIIINDTPQKTEMNEYNENMKMQNNLI